jgi:hypothetical protein
LSVELLARINQYLGSQAARRLRFVQVVAAPALVRPKPRLSAAADGAAAKAVAKLSDGPLRTALAALGRAVLSESASRLRQ